jgi:hypothetical protein
MTSVVLNQVRTCRKKVVVLKTHFLTDIETEEPYGSKEQIEERLRSAYRKSFSLEENESHLYGRIS